MNDGTDADAMDLPHGAEINLTMKLTVGPWVDGREGSDEDEEEDLDDEDEEDLDEDEDEEDEDDEDEEDEDDGAEAYVRYWSGPLDCDGDGPMAACVERQPASWPLKSKWKWSAGDPFSDKWVLEGVEGGETPDAAMASADRALATIASDLGNVG